MENIMAKEKLPLMPKATAVWLIDNTGLTFAQIGAFCGLHDLEVQALADGDMHSGMSGIDPISNGQLTREEISKGEKDDKHSLQLQESDVPEVGQRKGPRYTPVSKRGDKPNAIAWLVKNEPNLTDPQICRLVGTTKPTITAIRDKTHWNSANLVPESPVVLGLCNNAELEAARSAAPRIIKVEDVEGEGKTA